MKTKTITIMGKDVSLAYCAATETGYETISGKSIQTFVPTFGKDEQGKDIIKEAAPATMQDYILLAIAAIVCYYARKDEEAPVNSDDIIYECKPAEVTLLVATVLELRNEWYNIPKIVADQIKTEAGDEKADDSPKNAQPPTNG